MEDASVVVTEDLGGAGMLKNRRLAMSIADAGWGIALRQISYKSGWRGILHLEAQRFEPSTQTCSCCGDRKRGAGRGLVIDRDLNAALNLRRIGLERFGLQARHRSTKQEAPPTNLG